ncbi:MAG: peptide ABC transporter substrate-binding protein [Clostridiaceae bacterium]|jgi:oligopeptide transport system substrate-binding protein|nr:peptide ABC transporter substrate-binding protein [Clostridiaceae bacterium]
MKKRIIKILSFVLIMSLLLSVFTACGSKKDDQGESSVADEEASDDITEQPEDSGEQKIIVSLNNEPDGIDPNITSNSFAAPFLANCFEGLVTVDENSELIPGLAEKWEISEDGKTYTFTLRAGLKWSDGSDLNAEDFVYSAERVLTPETTAEYVNMLSDYIVNAQEFFDGEVEFSEVGVEATDENTLVYTLNEPTPFFLDVLSMPVYAPVQKATIEANGDQWTLSPEAYVTDGPFKVIDMKMGESVTLAKNEHYYNADQVKIEEITFRYIKDDATALSAFQKGEIDCARNVPAADVPKLKAETNDLYTIPQYATTFYLINNSVAPFDDVNVRKALNLALDREAIIANVLQSEDMAASALVSPGYSVDGKDYADGRSDYDINPQGDVEEAKRLLAEAGYPDGEGFPTLELSYYTDEQVKLVVEAMAQMFKDNLGIEVNISNEEWAVYFENVKAGNYQVAAMGWGADYLHPMTFFPLFVSTDQLNNSFYGNEAYDSAVAASKVIQDPAEGIVAMREAEDILMADYPLIPLYHRSTNLLMNGRVKGWNLTPTNNFYFRNAYIEDSD